VPAGGVLHAKTPAEEVALLLKKTSSDSSDSLERRTIFSI